MLITTGAGSGRYSGAGVFQGGLHFKEGIESLPAQTNQQGLYFSGSSTEIVKSHLCVNLKLVSAGILF